MTEPNRQPEGVPTGGQFAPNTHAEPALSLSAAEPVPAVTATVDLQLWHNDYAVTCETVSFDAGPILARMSPDERAGIEDSAETADQLYFEAVRRGLVQDHNGPFALSVRTAMDEAEEDDPGVWDKIAAVPQARKADAILDTPLTPYELGARAGSDGWVEGLATFEMDDFIHRDLESHGDQIGEKLAGSELLMDVSARPVSVTPEGSIVCRLSGDASAIIEGFDEDELAEYEAGRAEAGWKD